MEGSEDVSLYELWSVLTRRRRVLFGVFLGVTVLGVAYAVLTPPVYRYTTAVELGGYIVKNPASGDRNKHYLQTPDEVIQKLKEVYIPSATAATESEDGDIIEVNVEHEAGAGLVLLRSKADAKRANAIEAVHWDVVARLLANHEALAAQEERRRQLALVRAQRSLEHMEDTRVRTARLEPKQKKVADAEQALKTLEEDHRIEKLSLENGIQTKRREIVRLKEEREYLGQERARLETLGKLLEQQIAEGKRLTGVLEQSQAGLEAAATEASDAFGLLLVTVQLEQAERRQADLKERLAVKLPQQADKLTEQLAETGRRHTTAGEELEELKAKLHHALTSYESRQATLERELQAARTSLGEETAQYERDLDTAREAVDIAKLALEEIHPTTSLLLAMPSTKPVGAGTAVLAALAAILGLIMGVFMAFVVEFVARTRGHAYDQPATDGGDDAMQSTPTMVEPSVQHKKLDPFPTRVP